MGNFLTNFFSSGVEGVLNGIGGLAKNLRTAITGEEALSSEQRKEILDQVNELERLGLELETTAAKGQIELNKIDAASGSLFKGGWRPFLGWVCGFGFFYTFLARPLLPWAVDTVFRFVSLFIDDAPVFIVPDMPALETGELMSLTMALLGMGGIRMYEKIKGVASK